MKKMLFSAAVLLMLGAGSALASVSETTDYLTAQRPPTLVGTISAVNDHQIVLNTNTNEIVLLQTDSHSMLPPDMAPGMVAKVEFKVMENGQHYTQRVIPIRGEDEAALALLNPRATDRYYAVGEPRTFSQERVIVDDDRTRLEEQARLDREARIRAEAEARDAQMRADRLAQDRLDREADARDHNNATPYEGEALPQTASNEPLIALAGVLALAGAFTLARRRRGA